jgi:hypothetical protein
MDVRKKAIVAATLVDEVQKKGEDASADSNKSWFYAKLDIPQIFESVTVLLHGNVTIPMCKGCFVGFKSP